MRNKLAFKRLSAFCAGAMLLACTDLSGHREPNAQAASRADDAYIQGRNQHLGQHYEEAAASYRAALQADPGHINARNGLATLYAEQRQFAQAIEIWRALTDKLPLAAGPGKAFLFGNLGHAYFLNGDYDNALAAFEKACLLDPLNDRAWHRLGETLQELGQDERAQQMFRQAAALREHDFRTDYAKAGGETEVAAIETAVKSAPHYTQEWAYTDVRVAADGTLELRRVPGPSSASTAPAGAPLAFVPPPVPSQAAPVVFLEIRNGNGVTGMARALSRQLGDKAMKVTRLTNEKGFNVRRTRVEYEVPFRAAAERLAARFGSAQVLEVASCKKTDMRLVIGRDLPRRDFTLRPLPQPPESAPLVAAKAPHEEG